MAASTSLSNAKYVGSLIADGTTDNDKQQRSFIVEVYARYVQVALFNNMGQALEAVGTYGSYCSLTPLSQAVQAAS